MQISSATLTNLACENRPFNSWSVKKKLDVNEVCWK